MTAEQRARCCSDGITSKRLVDGVMVVSGSGGLKDTQAYTPAYAAAVVESWMTWAEGKEMPDDDSSESDYDEFVDDTWPDLRMDDVLELLTGSQCARA